MDENDIYDFESTEAQWIQVNSENLGINESQRMEDLSNFQKENNR